MKSDILNLSNQDTGSKSRKNLKSGKKIESS